jgi:hypothetical protein
MSFSDVDLQTRRTAEKAQCRATRPLATRAARWAVEDHKGFTQRYWDARRAQCIHLSEQIVSIADEAIGSDMAGANVAKLRCDARKFVLARMDPLRWSASAPARRQRSDRGRQPAGEAQ